ncbi:MAG: class I SAM-dependent methyltransferase [Methylococcaceae bacterium]|nr:class I SAM-dependent methyltransferase [Methylococcaceae bacterium]
MKENNFNLHTHYSIQSKLDNFELYVRRQSLTRFLARYELFKQTLDVKGSIIECGVHHGGGLMAWAKMSAGLEPMAIHRKVYGFDTFEGFPSVDKSDFTDIQENNHLVTGGFSAGKSSFEYINDAITEFDDNRFLNQFNKVELIKGDATKTIPEFMEKNQHLIISLLFLDFDLYEPTKAALEYFLTRVPKGGIIAFDEINNASWPGETKALFEQKFSLNHLKINKFYFEPNIAYIVL